MKKITAVLLFLLVLLATMPAQNLTYSEMKDSFSAFSSDVSSAIPFASTIGLQWSDTTVRSFPHFGAGLSVGAVTIPEKAFTTLAKTMEFALPSELTDLGIGIPFPAYTLDARIGLPFLPLDIGVKFGIIPPDTLKNTPFTVDYTLAGVDVRVPVIKQNVILPSVSLGAGFNYLSSMIGTTATGLGTSMDLSSINNGLGTLQFSDPDIAFRMESKVIDAKLQVSKSLLIFTPYIGVGYSYGWSKAGGGILANIKYNGNKLTQSDIESINNALDTAGQPPLDLSSTQILISSSSTGGAFRAFGGVSLNIFILKLDIGGMYNLQTKSLGASLNARVAF